MIIFIILVLKMDNINIPHKDNRESIISVVKNPFVLFTSIAIFLYVGSELSTTNWTGTFLESHYHISKADVPNILMGFWILFTFGRAVGDILLEKIGQLKFLMISPIITLLGIFILITGKNSFQALVGIAIIGMTISIIYPALQSYIVQNVKKENIPPVTIIISLFNCTGATVLTYAVGFAGSINISYVYLIQVFFYLYIIMLAIKLLFFNKKRYDI
jgi:fucose permease